MTKTEKKKMCVGCTENCYNQGYLGVYECWFLTSARVVDMKFVPLTLAPPWDMPAERTLSCYRRKGYVKVDAKKTR